MMSERFLPVAEPVITEEDAQAVYEVVRSGWIKMGAKVREFEQAFADYVSAKHAVATFNGTVSLHTALEALGVGPGDEVIVPSLTFISSANTVLHTGAKLVLCDVEPATYNVSREHIEPLITQRTKVIMTVDMNGMPVDYDSLCALADERGLTLLADSAESLGARYRGKLIGSQAALHSFSMFPNKGITTGEGGMLTTNDDELARRARMLRDQGQEGRYHHVILGYNYRMTDIQAALGISQLKRIESTMADKEKVARAYNEALQPLKQLLSIPYLPDYVTRHSWYMYAISVADGVDRDGVVKGLAERGIDTRLSFPPVHIQPYYVERFGYSPPDYPLCYRAWCRLIDLPVSPRLSLADINRVVASLRVVMAAE